MSVKSKKKLKVIWFLSLAVFLLFFLFEVYMPKSLNLSPMFVYTVQKGMGDRDIARELENQGTIKNNWFFSLYVLISGSNSKLQAGKYQLSPSMSIAKIVKKFVLGDVIREKITIIEGWSIKDIGKELERKKIYSQKDFSDLIKKDFSQDFGFLKDKPKNRGLEGYIFPDTYYIYSDETPEDLLRVILANFGKKLTADLRIEIAAQNKSIFQIITMASIIEKEVKSFEDKKIISGILWKRIIDGIPLQVDATVNYITGKNDVKVAIEDTKIDSLYNTYKYYGLPSGPISNPGIDSIMAAIYPEKSSYWYYLSADHNGETIFSKTLKEHNEAVAKYLK